MSFRGLVPGRPPRSDLGRLLLDGEGAHVELDHDGRVPTGVVPEVQHSGVRDQGQQPLVTNEVVERSDASVICVYMCVINVMVFPQAGQPQSVQESPDCQGEAGLSGHLPVDISTPKYIIILRVVQNSLNLIQHF